MQLLNLFLIWIFFGFLCSYLAKKRGKNANVWFIIGLLLGLIGVLLVLIVAKKTSPNKPQLAPILPKIEPPKEPRFWYYFDKNNDQKGPIEDLAPLFRAGELQRESFVWSEGMENWKRLSELPNMMEELAEISASSP